jgi:hypothetical protein
MHDAAVRETACDHALLQQHRAAVALVEAAIGQAQPPGGEDGEDLLAQQARDVIARARIDHDRADVLFTELQLRLETDVGLEQTVLHRHQAVTRLPVPR